VYEHVCTSRRRSGEGNGTEQEVPQEMTNTGAMDVKVEDQVMLEEVFGAAAMASSQAKPNPLTGPLEEARQEK
jgi:hypothetical protein